MIKHFFFRANIQRIYSTGLIEAYKGCEQWKTGDDRLSGYAQVIVTNCKERQKQVYDVLRLFVADRSVLNVNC